MLDSDVPDGTDQMVPISAPVERELRAAVRAHAHQHAHRTVPAGPRDSAVVGTRPRSGTVGSGGSARPLSASGA